MTDFITRSKLAAMFEAEGRYRLTPPAGPGSANHGDLAVGRFCKAMVERLKGSGLHPAALEGVEPGLPCRHCGKPPLGHVEDGERNALYCYLKPDGWSGSWPPAEGTIGRPKLDVWRKDGRFRYEPDGKGA